MSTKKNGVATTYAVSDGTLELNMTYDGEKWFVVTCPSIPDLVTQAKTIPEAFDMAYDAKALLEEYEKEQKQINPVVEKSPSSARTLRPARSKEKKLQTRSRVLSKGN